MNFKEAYALLKRGEKIALPEWGGFWAWDDEVKSIIIHCKDGRVLDIRETKDVDYTIMFALRTDWEVFTAPLPKVTEESLANGGKPYWWESIHFEPEEPHVLKRGMSGDRVLALQQELNRHGAKLPLIGKYGPSTEKAVRDIQMGLNLVADGVFGDKTAMCLMGESIPTYLSQADMVAAAKKLGCQVEVVMAVASIESRGHGFWSNGEPVILYERHVMYRQLKAIGIEPGPFVIADPNIVNPRSGGYIGGIPEYDRLNKAKAIHTECGLESASWGCFQVMAYHWKRLKYSSVHDFVDRMDIGESEHLESFVRYIQADPRLLKAITAKQPDFMTFATLYNGPAAVAKNNYPQKAQNEFTRLVSMRV